MNNEAVKFLTEAKNAMEDLQAEKVSLANLETEEKRLDKELNAAKKNLEDTITSTIRKRKDEITSTYDKELGNAQGDLKKAKSRREAARAKGVKVRIEDETAGLKEDNRRIRTELDTMFKKERVPSFCKTNLYYALYFPRGFAEHLVRMLIMLFLFLILPCGVYKLIPDHTTWMLAVIYFACIFIFAQLYVIIGDRTKMRHMGPIMEGRRVKDMIQDNNHKIKAVHNAISKDRNDEYYGLEEFDKEIQQLEADMEDIGNRKQAALTTFENETSGTISAELRSNAQAQLDSLTASLSSTVQSRKEAEANVQRMSTSLSDNYEAIIGKDFMTAEKIDTLVNLLKKGEAQNISEAESHLGRKDTDEEEAQ